MNKNLKVLLAPARWFPALLLLVAPVVFPAERALEPHIAEYKVKISVLSGTLTSEMYKTEEGFAAHSIIRPTGFASLLMSGTISEYSEFSLTGDGIRPQHYESTDTLSSDPKRMTFDFDYSEQAVSGQINDENFRFEFDGPVHDRVSIQYQLMHNLLNQNGGGDYALLDGDELKELTVTNIGSRKVRVPFGTFEAVGIQHRAAESSRVSTLWCVAELNYLPVIIEQHRDGKLRVRAVLENYRPLQSQAAEQQAGVSRPGLRVALPASGRP
ncbi:MAG: DUF3108 domain-containing protein [Woeseia sp.]